MLGELRASLFGGPSTPVCIDRYVLDKRIGRGASGAVFSAYDERLCRSVALKLIRLDGKTPASTLVERIQREAHTLARLSHPNVVQVYDVGQHGDNLYLAMELVEGQSLEAWQHEEHSWSEILEMYRRAGEGLVAAHGGGVVHKDFKPANVIIGRDGQKVCVCRLWSGADDERGDGGDCARARVGR